MNICMLVRNDDYSCHSNHWLNSTLYQEATYSCPILPAVTNAFTINYHPTRRNNPTDLGYFNLILCFSGFLKTTWKVSRSGLFQLRQFQLCQFPLHQFSFGQLPTLSIPTVNSHFVYSHFIKENFDWRVVKWLHATTEEHYNPPNQAQICILTCIHLSNSYRQHHIFTFFLKYTSSIPTLSIPTLSTFTKIMGIDKVGSWPNGNWQSGKLTKWELTKWELTK